MASLFTLRSIVILTLGLIVGLLLGLGYWYISPVDANVQAGWPPLRVVGITDSRPTLYRSTVDIEMVARGEDFTDAKTLQRQGEYIEGKFVSYSFLQFLSQEVEKMAPEYSHTLNDFAAMISSKYLYDNINATVQLRIDSYDVKEAAFLVQFVPQSLHAHLIMEERAKWSSEYERTVAEFDSAIGALVEATAKRSSMQMAVDTIERDPAYILALAKAEGLRIELDSSTGALAALIAEGAQGGVFENAVERMSRIAVALAEAREALLALQVKSNAEQMKLGLEYVTSTAEVEALNREVTNLARALVSLSGDEPEGLEMFGLVAVGEPSDPEALSRDRMRGRNALMMGIVLGLGGAWVGLNYKGWLKGMGSSPRDTVDLEEDEES